MTTKTHFEILRKRIKKYTKTHRKSLQKRINLKIEDNQIGYIAARILCTTYIRWGDIRFGLLWRNSSDNFGRTFTCSFGRLSLTSSAHNLYCFILHSIVVCMIRNQFDTMCTLTIDDHSLQTTAVSFSYIGLWQFRPLVHVKTHTKQHSPILTFDWQLLQQNLHLVHCII